MPHLRASVTSRAVVSGAVASGAVVGVVAALAALPLVLGEPAGATSVTSPAAGSGSATASTAPRERLLAGSGSGSGGATGTGIPVPQALWVSDGAAATRVPFATDGTPGAPTRTTGLTDVVYAPAGDARASTPLPGGGSTTVSGVGAAVGTTYPASEVPVVWGPGGDGFVERRDGVYVAQLTNPDVTYPLDLPDGASDPAVGPYGGEAVVRVPAGGGGHDLAGVPSPFLGAAASSGVVPFGLAAYDPGAPALSQAPGAGVGVWGGADGATHLAFTGVVPGSDPALRRVFVDHQDAADPATGGYGAPVAVAAAGPECPVAAPAFSPDGRRLAYVRSLDAGCGTFEVHVVTAGGDDRFGPADADVTVLTTDGSTPVPTVLSWQARSVPAAQVRIGGADRYEVSAGVARLFDRAVVDGAVVAGGRAPADALAGGPLAAHLGGPTLLTDPTRLRDTTRQALEDVVPLSATVYVLGGRVSVADDVVTSLEDLGYHVLRLGGADRYEVAVKVARTLDGLRGRAPRAAFVSSGKAFADALVSGPPAHASDAPILLSNGPRLPAVTASYLDALPPDTELFAIGGAGSQSVIDYAPTVIGGATRYDVAANVASYFFDLTWTPGLADGRNWPDAVSGGPLMAQWSEPILLANGRSTLPAATAEVLLRSRASVDVVVAFGGPVSVPEDTLAAAQAAGGLQTPYYGPDLAPPGP